MAPSGIVKSWLSRSHLTRSKIDNPHIGVFSIILTNLP